jgi:acetyltransferase
MSCKLLEEALVRFSQLVVDFPEFQEIVIDPLLVDQTRVVALDSKALIQKEALSEKAETYSHLIISPYPRKYVSKLALKDGRSVTLRPIKPEDEPLVLGLFRSFSPETMRQRFFYVIKEIPHEMLVKYCNIDYDREATIVAETVDPEGRKIVGMAGLVVEPDGVSAEMSAVVTDSWQGLGLGSGLFDKILEIAKDMGVRRVYGIVQPENYRVIRLCEKKGFRIDRCDPSECLVTFKIEREKEVRGEKEELYWISGT